MLIVWHLPPLSSLRESRSAIAMGPLELSLRQAFGAIEVGIGQIRTVEPCQAEIRTAQIGAAQRGPDKKRATEQSIAEVSPIEQRIAKSGSTQVRFTEIALGEHGGIELSAAHVSFAQAGALPH